MIYKIYITGIYRIAWVNILCIIEAIAHFNWIWKSQGYKRETLYLCDKTLGKCIDYNHVLDDRL